jgi:hypothetical protein
MSIPYSLGNVTPHIDLIDKPPGLGAGGSNLGGPRGSGDMGNFSANWVFRRPKVDSV